MLLVADAGAQISVAWGITVGLLASFVQSLGLTVQRKSHVLNEQLPEDMQRVEYRRPLWLLGFTIFISSNILGSLFQIASLPVVILAPLGAVSLLWNAFFARLLLGDVFSPWMLIGTILIAGGAVLIAIFGIVPEPNHSLEDLLQLFRRPAFIAYFSLLGVAVVACLVSTHIAEFSLRRSSQINSVSEESLVPSLEDVPNERTLLLDRKLTNLTRSSSPTSFIDPATSRRRLLLAISYASASGILSGICLLFAKSGVELLILTIGGKNQFWRWEAWALLIGLVAFALLQLWYLQKSLVFADPTIVCPLAFCFYNVSSIVNGLVYFDQFSLLSPLHLSLVSLGMVTLLGGVWVVSFHAGSGRVDVGTWQEGDDDLEDVDTREAVRIENGYSSPLFSPPGMIESALSDSDAPRSPSVHMSHSITFPISPQATEPGQSSQFGLPVQTALLPSSQHTAPFSPSGGTAPGRRRRRRISLLQPTDSSALNVPAGGFSIGLSPVSPGFAIVPKRRLAGKLRRVVARATMRRTVSENDVSGDARQGRTVSAPILNGQQHSEGDYGRASEADGGEQRKAKARWNWLRAMFTDSDGS